jgi:L-methionine (R)-S-oxide reductase
LKNLGLPCSIVEKKGNIKSCSSSPLALWVEDCILIVPRGGFLNFSTLTPEVDTIMAGAGDPGARLLSLCVLLKARVPHYNWFGFYIARRDAPLLDLGPYAGESTTHTLIPFGRGICGQAAESGDTFVVDDVSSASNYLACSLKVKSEIVVPVFVSGTREVAGEIDIDSHAVAAFSAEDRAFLENLALTVADDLAALRL